jgi:hypothetical protein
MIEIHRRGTRGGEYPSRGHGGSGEGGSGGGNFGGGGE